MADQKLPENIEGWKPIKKLGEGGNCSVYLAERGGSGPVALKVLHVGRGKKAAPEKLQRLRDEVTTLTKWKGHPGIMPILDANLDEHSPWFTMAVATPIREALGPNLDLARVVEAVASIAETLTELAAEDTHHRDIKPDNLYYYDGQWVISDFGLVSFPGKVVLTDNTRQIGARNFTAPEMIVDPMHADGGPADVYSLSKTLWVLATAKTYPPSGPQRLDDIGATLEGSGVVYPQLRKLDGLIERATRNDPTDRPPMRQLAALLRDWLSSVQSQSQNPDLLTRARNYLATGETRIAGILAGQLLEEELQMLCKSRGISARNKVNIGELNRTLLSSGVYDEAQANEVDKMRLIRNQCAHQETGEPSNQDVGWLISSLEGLAAKFNLNSSGDSPKTPLPTASNEGPSATQANNQTSIHLQAPDIVQPVSPIAQLKPRFERSEDRRRREEEEEERRRQEAQRIEDKARAELPIAIEKGEQVIPLILADFVSASELTPAAMKKGHDQAYGISLPVWIDGLCVRQRPGLRYEYTPERVVYVALEWSDKDGVYLTLHLNEKCDQEAGRNNTSVLIRLLEEEMGTWVNIIRGQGPFKQLYQ